MPVLTMSATDLLAGFQRLLPTGDAWPQEPDSTLNQALATLMPTTVRLVERDNNLLTDAFPATAVELLPEWEESLGLPDPCAGESPTIAEREGQVVARLTNTGGQSVPFFTGYAANLGYTVSIQEFAPARIGISRIGDPLNSEAWAHVWRVNAPSVTVTYALCGSACVGDPLATWGNAVLECELRRIAPAHTVVQFAYS
jgi:uncharacterized protein YmfQ (DUF2313 family)